MKIISDPARDSVTPSKPAGGYEWWYFDAIDPISGYAIIVIFYEGNPFSNRYIRALSGNEKSSPHTPDNFPAVSISVYKYNKPVYYSFTEYPKEEAGFSIEKAAGRAGEHRFKQDLSSDELCYSIKLEEELASGDRIGGTLRFSSSQKVIDLFKAEKSEEDSHTWNLIQPHCKVNGHLQLHLENKLQHDIQFEGAGYHDHNTGQEPMKDEFDDWYWGRFHFEEQTLIYYVMNRQAGPQYRAWLIAHEDHSIDETFTNIELTDRSRSLFGLRSARKIHLSEGDAEILIQQNKLLDNGPFYQRYLSDAFLRTEGNEIQKAAGITEYIRPDRIYQKLFWPFVDMRIRYEREEAHWVQKSPMLYRWTW